MKIHVALVHFPLLIALGVAAQLAFAQVQTAPHPPLPADIQPQQDVTPTSGAGTPDSPAAGQAPPASGLSSGAPDPMRSEAGADLRALPSPVAGVEPVVQGDVTYLCGGIGAEEAAYMKNEAKDYDLMLTFAARDGAYLADVDVDIADARGNAVLQANCDAPILLVDLPHSGSYRVRADAAGYTLNRTVNVSAAKRNRRGIASASLVWPQQVAEGQAPEPAATSTGDSGTGDSGDNDSGAR